MKLDRLKEIAADDDVLRFPSQHLPEYGEVMKALPGLLRVCHAHMSLLIAMRQWEGFTYDRAYEQAEKKLEELLG